MVDRHAGRRPVSPGGHALGVDDDRGSDVVGDRPADRYAASSLSVSCNRVRANVRVRSRHGHGGSRGGCVNSGLPKRVFRGLTRLVHVAQHAVALCVTYGDVGEVAEGEVEPVVSEYGMSRRRFLTRAGLLGVVGFAGGGLVLAACGDDSSDGSDSSSQSVLDRLRSQGYVRAGFANEAPFAFAQPDGTLDGEAITVAQYVFNELGVDEVVGVLTEFGSLIPALQANRFDVIAAGMFIRPERCEQIVFSDPDYCLGEAMVVHAGNPFDLHSYDDVAANPEVQFGEVAGGAESEYATAAGIHESQRVTFPDGPTALAGLQAGRIDVFSLTTLSARSLVERANDPNVELVSPFTDPVIDGQSVKGCGGYGFRQDDQELRDSFNEVLLAATEDGTVLELIEPFGFEEADIAGPEDTADNLCGAG